MAESGKDLELRDVGVDCRKLLEDNDNPDAMIFRNICGVRAKIRNNFRVPILETTALLGNEVPSMTKEDIMREEVDRLLCRARRNLRIGVFAEVSDAYGEALRYHSRKEGTDDVYKEEYAKYLAGDAIRDWLRRGEDVALKSFRHIKGKSYIAEEIRNSAVDEGLFEIKCNLLLKIRNGAYREVVDGMMKIAEEKPIHKGDLLDLGMSSEEEEGLLAYVDHYMPILLYGSPRIYEVVGDLFKKMGFNSARWKVSAEMKYTVKAIIVRSFKAGICYLCEILDEFERMGLVDIEEVRNWPEYNEVLNIRLGEAMKLSPDAYVQIRDYYVLSQLIPAEKADMMKHVRIGLNNFFEDLKRDTTEVAAYSYSKHLRKIGVKTPISDSMSEKWRDYEDIEKTYGQDVLEYEIGRDKAEEIMEMLEDRANRLLSADKSYELKVFNKVRGVYSKNLEVFLGRFPYFQRYYSDYRFDYVVEEDDDEDEE